MRLIGAAENIDIEVQLEAQLKDFYPATASIPSIPCLKSLIYSGWNPPPGYRRLQGLYTLFLFLSHSIFFCLTLPPAITWSLYAGADNIS